MCHLFPAGSPIHAYILLLKATISPFPKMLSIFMKVFFSDISFDIPPFQPEKYLGFSPQTRSQHNTKGSSVGVPPTGQLSCTSSRCPWLSLAIKCLTTKYHIYKYLKNLNAHWGALFLSCPSGLWPLRLASHTTDGEQPTHDSGSHGFAVVGNMCSGVGEPSSEGHGTV